MELTERKPGSARLIQPLGRSKQQDRPDRDPYHRTAAKGCLKSKGSSNERVVVWSRHQPSHRGNPPLRDRLTLKSTHPPDQTAAPAERPARTPRQQQPQELQSAFLDGILDQSVTVFLINGICLTGTVKPHDAFTLHRQDADSLDFLIFKHVISSSIPGTPVPTRERRTPFGKRPERTG